MKYYKSLSPTLLILLAVGPFLRADVETSSRILLGFFDDPRDPLAPAMEMLPAGSVYPEGWILDIMEEDLKTGFVGHLDKLAPVLFADEPFTRNQRKDAHDIPRVGTQELTGEAWEISMQWWAGETEGNWWDGLARHAFLTGNAEVIDRIKGIVEDILSYQDSDGYMGIYSPEMRYRHTGSNGELWTQATLFRFLLGYYEFSGDEKVLHAVVRAMDLTMERYGPEGREPFDVEVDYGGVSHGLMMTDVCESLFRITGDTRYNDYAVFLYRNFSKYPITRNMNDMRYETLLGSDSLFQGHSAHTYEHLRTILLAYYLTGYPQLKLAYGNALKKLRTCILPSGAGFGNEWIGNEIADPDTTAAEFCGMIELREFYLSALQKSGDTAFADAAEKLTYNAMQGARNEDGSAITYCKTDNCHILNCTAPQHEFEEDDPRYKYSPTHRDAAVCCNPSYSRSLPYFVQSMWMRAEDGLAVVLYGPSRLKTEWKDVEVEIQALTHYPFEDRVEFTISTSEPVEFSIYVRKPDWSDRLEIDVSGARIEPVDGYYKVTKSWSVGDRLVVNFENAIFPVEANNGEFALQRGPLVYALEIPHSEEVIKEYDLEGFRDYYCFPEDESFKNLSFTTGEAGSGFTYQPGTLPDAGYPWFLSGTSLTGQLVDLETEEVKEFQLVPMGGTILRQVTFPVK